MFVRKKKSGSRVYLQIVENRWEDGRSKQRVVATLGRWDRLRESGELDRLLGSAAKFSESALVLSAHERGEATRVNACQIGPGLIFERLWRETGCQSVVASCLNGRRFSFPVERAVFQTVLHRLFAPGSDRAGDRWRRDVRIEGGEEVDLHHLYRAMARGWARNCPKNSRSAEPPLPRGV